MPDNARPFISLNNVSIRLDDQVLFKDLSWEILDDQQWAIVGPNGSGKSTLMRALAGSLPVVKGHIVYHFQENGCKSGHEQIAYVSFESQRMVLSEYAFHQARWNAGVAQDSLSLSEFLSWKNISRNNPYHVVDTGENDGFEERRRDIVERLELERQMERTVIQLSNGERRKATIARALLKNPRLLILDNPFSGLDERFRARLAENLDNLMKDKLRVMITGTNRDEMPHSITKVLSVLWDSAVSPNRVALSHRHCTARSAVQEMPHRSERPVRSDPRTQHATSGKPLVHMGNVHISYNGTPVLRDLNWVIRENERWALLGPNGAGKTTLLSLILADNPQAYANNITLFGKRRGSGESIWEIKQKIGWVAPELQLYYSRSATCLDVVCSGWFDSVGLYNECSAQQRHIARSWLQRFGLVEHAETALDRVSEGEQRLVLLARALVKSPTLLVLDEPCQGLDTDNRDRVLQAIESSTDRLDTSMICVAHRADELPCSLTHVLRLDEGRVVENRQLKEIKQDEDSTASVKMKNP